MVAFSSLLAFSLATVASVSARPVQKRATQVIAESTQPWVAACQAAGGAQRCGEISITAFSTLLAAPPPCAQQDAADQMIDLAKELGGDAEMIRLAQIFRQQARNAPDRLSVRYCQTPPRNAELNGLFQCQFDDVNFEVFTTNIAVGGAETIPLGLNAPLTPPGSCPANPGGPIPDGSQLHTLVNNPGQAIEVGAGAGEVVEEVVEEVPEVVEEEEEIVVEQPEVVDTPPPAAGGGVNPPGAPAFTLSNGQAAQALNARFATLNAASTCQPGEQACIDGGFAQCVGGSFAVVGCAGGTQCFALPLVNAAGTSITCSTAADAEARIANTGALGGITGNGSVAAAPAPVAAPAPAPVAAAPVAAAPAPAAPVAGAREFTLSNGQLAQSQNAEFAGLSADSACTDGTQACVAGGFAQCVGGRFLVTGCSAPTQCFALPLVNAPGSSITCTTPEDAAARIAATGATGGITGALVMERNDIFSR